MRHPAFNFHSLLAPPAMTLLVAQAHFNIFRRLTISYLESKSRICLFGFEFDAQLIYFKNKLLLLLLFFFGNVGNPVTKPPILGRGAGKRL